MNEKIAEKILQEDRNLTGAYKKLEGFARAGHLTCVTDLEGFSIIDSYFDIVPADYEEDPVPDIRIDDDFDILDFLEG